MYMHKLKGYVSYRDIENRVYDQVQTPTHLKLIPHHGLQHKVQIIAGTEPLNDDGSPPHCEARKSSKAREGGYYGQIYKNIIYSVDWDCYTIVLHSYLKFLSKCFQKTIFNNFIFSTFTNLFTKQTFDNRSKTNPVRARLIVGNFYVTGKREQPPARGTIIYYHLPGRNPGPELIKTIFFQISYFLQPKGNQQEYS